MTSISFFVPYTPRPQPRQRHSVAADQKNLRLVRAWKARVLSAFKDAIKGDSLIVDTSQAVECRAVFYIPREKAHPTRTYPLGTPDGDNLTKAVWDALNKLAWCDDCQIVQWSGAKRYAKNTAGVGCYVTIRRVEDCEVEEL